MPADEELQKTRAELEQLRTEVAQLREGCKLMFAALSATLPLPLDTGGIAYSLMENIGQMQQKERGDAFDDMAAAALLAISSAALKAHPGDQAVLDLYRGLRGGTGH